MGRKISLSIKRSALKANWFVKGKTGEEYLTFDVYENDEPDKYGNQWAVKQAPPKEIRADLKQRGEKIPYCGNGKEWGSPPTSAASQNSQQAAAAKPQIDEDVPF